MARRSFFSFFFPFSVFSLLVFPFSRVLHFAFCIVFHGHWQANNWERGWVWRGFGNNNRNFFPLPISVPRAKGGEREGRGTWKIPLTSAFLARKPNYLHKFGWPIWRFVFLLRVSLATAPLTFLFNGPARASFFHFFFHPTIISVFGFSTLLPDTLFDIQICLLFFIRFCSFFFCHCCDVGYSPTFSQFRFERVPFGQDFLCATLFFLFALYSCCTRYGNKGLGGEQWFSFFFSFLTFFGRFLSRFSFPRMRVVAQGSYFPSLETEEPYLARKIDNSQLDFRWRQVSYSRTV